MAKRPADVELARKKLPPENVCLLEHLEPQRRPHNSDGLMMKFFSFATLLVLVFSLAFVGCATPDDEERRRASPPPGSHSPFAHPDDNDGMRDQPEPPPPEPMEDEPDEPEPER